MPDQPTFQKVSDTEFDKIETVSTRLNVNILLARKTHIISDIAASQAHLDETNALIAEAERLGIS